MNPSRIVPLLAFAALPMAASASGCSSSSSTGTFDDAGSSDVAQPDGSTSSSDSGSSGSGEAGGDDGGACSPVPVSSVPAYTAVKQMLGACSSGQISAYVTACASGSGSTACNAWQMDSTNGTCLGCLVGNPANTGALLVSSSNQIIEDNVPGCIALKDATLGPACAMALEPDIQCAHASCASCGDQTSFDACSQATLGSGGPCNREANSVKTACFKEGVASMACASTQDVISVICGAG